MVKSVSLFLDILGLPKYFHVEGENEIPGCEIPPNKFSAFL
jgi:hypothetical protein